MLKSLLQEAAELGASAAIAQCGLLKPYMSKQEAYNVYGRSDVDKWVKSGLITPRKDGQYSTKWKIDRIEIESVAKVINRKNLNLITCQ